MKKEQLNDHFHDSDLHLKVWNLLDFCFFWRLKMWLFIYCFFTIFWMFYRKSNGKRKVESGFEFSIFELWLCCLILDLWLFHHYFIILTQKKKKTQCFCTNTKHNSIWFWNRCWLVRIWFHNQIFRHKFKHLVKEKEKENIK